MGDAEDRGRQPIEILHLEDDDNHAVLMQALLARMKGLPTRVTRAITVAEAERRLDEATYGVILADLHLPDADAEQTLARLEARRGSAPLIAITGSGRSDFGPQAVSMGAQDFLTKDVLDPALIERTVRFAIEREVLNQRLKVRTEELSELLDVARTELSQRLDEIANRCRDLDQRANRTAVPSNSIWFRDTERFARETKSLVESLHDHFDPTEPIERQPATASEALREVQALEVQDGEDHPPLAIPPSALRRAVETLVGAVPGLRCVLTCEPSYERPHCSRLTIRGEPMSIETRGNLSADLYREALSLELALALRLSRFTVRRHGGDCWLELRDNGQFAMHLDIPQAGTTS